MTEEKFQDQDLHVEATEDVTEAAKEGQCIELQQKIDELQAKYTRLAADFDNYRKRAERNSRETIARANQNLICGLLPVIDNFCLALGSINDESVQKGVKMIYEQLINLLHNEGLAEIDSIGCEFNPEVHEAVGFVQDDAHDDNVIVEELRKGYMLSGKIIRPGMVKVNIKKEE